MSRDSRTRGKILLGLLVLVGRSVFVHVRVDRPSMCRLWSVGGCISREWTMNLWGLFAGLWFAGRPVSVCAGTVGLCALGPVGTCAGVVSLQGRLQVLSAELTPGVDGRAPAPSLKRNLGPTVEQRGAEERTPPSRCLPSPAAGPPGSLEKFSQWRGCSQESAPLAPRIFPTPSAPPLLAAHPISTLTSVLSRARRPSSAQLPEPTQSAPELPRARLDRLPG